MTAEAEARRVVPAYPINLELRDQPALVVGGGAVAARKVAGLVEAGAVVTIVAPTLVAELRELHGARWHAREYQRGEAASYRVVIAATDDADVNAQVANDARATGVPVNSADDPINCTFTLPAVLRRGDLQVTVSTGGRSPALAAWLRSRLEAMLDDSYVELLDLLAETRDELRAHGASSESPAWRRALDGGLPELVAQGRHEEARVLLRRQLVLDGAVSLDTSAP